jgi:uncharacterized phosphosugar-binding protein
VNPRNGLSATARRYGSAIGELLGTALREEEGNLRAAAAVVARSWDADGLLYIFGSGHSHMFAEEAFYRAGGAARICPVLQPAHMLHEGAVRSTVLERQTGHARDILDRYDIDAGRDCILVASNSGANALPIEVAVLARDMGLPVIAITSRQYAQAVRRPGPRLHEVADLVIDNHCPPGDALVRVSDEVGLPPTGPGSTIVGLTLLNTLVVEACAVAVEQGRRPDLFLSANMPGAAAHNDGLTAELAPRVPHL